VRVGLVLVVGLVVGCSVGDGEGAGDADVTEIHGGRDGGAGAGGRGGGGEGGRQVVVGMCTASAVASCPSETSACAERFCGGRRWAPANSGDGARIPYRIRDPEQRLSPAYREAIAAIASAWTDATDGHVVFEDCSTTSCTGRFISVIPGDGHGLLNADDGEQLLPMPVTPPGDGQPPAHLISHQWGHAIGLDDTYKRADRDRYVRFDPAVWCGDDAGVPPRCALDPAEQPGSPPVASGTFGVYDELSKMNGFATDGVCGAGEPDRTAGAPTAGDASAVLELYHERTSGSGWAPWQPIARSPSPTAPLDYQLAPGVDPVGGPTVAAGADPQLEIFVRGTDDVVYGTQNLLAGGQFTGWADWAPLGEYLDSDPAVAVLDQETLHLAARSALFHTVVVRTRASGTWSAWISLGAPAAGAASAPAVAALDGALLTVIVRGGDGLLYQQTCSDPHNDCIDNVGGYDLHGVDLWAPLDAPPETWSFVGKPNAVWAHDDGGDRLVVTAVGTDGRAHWLVRGDGSSGWRDLAFAGSADDPEPSVAVYTAGRYQDLSFLARDARGLLAQGNGDGALDPLGGLLASPPAATAAGSRVLAVGLMNDHGRPGVWWKFAGGFTPPCTTNAPDSCATCAH
jgi:hypothetical protein